MLVESQTPEQVQVRTYSLRCLLAPRRDSRFDRFSVVVLLIYASILAFTIHHYLPFSDEAQAWVMARDCSLRELLLRRLHYEGHPPLWAIFVWSLCRLHVPYQATNWIGGAFALIGIHVWLRFSPLPALFRFLLPFTYFLQYQYAAVFRPYLLFPALLFTLCVLFTLAKPRPIAFAAVAGLLINLSLHSAIIAGVFCALYAFELRYRRTCPLPRQSLVAAIGLLALCSICAAVPSLPAPDAATAFTPTERLTKGTSVLQKLIAEERLPSSAPPLDAPLDLHKKPSLERLSVPFLVLSFLFNCATIIFYPIAKSNLLALLFAVCLARWLWRRGCARLLLPSLVAVLISSRVFVFDHHTGQFFLAMVAAVWICLGSTTNSLRHRPGPQWNEPVFVAVSALVALLQIGWAFYCIRQGAHFPTDPGRDTEAYLVHNFSGKRIAGFTFESVSMQPYAHENLFSNQSTAYWIWSVNVNMQQRRTETLMMKPDVVVVGEITTGPEIIFDQMFQVVAPGTDTGSEMVAFWEQHGYRRVDRICGTQFRRVGVSYSLCEVVLARTNNAGESVRPVHTLQ